MAGLEEIASKLPKAIEELQRSNERKTEDAKQTQVRELADLRKEVRESTDKRTREHKDNVKKLERMNEDIREATKKEQELSKTTVGEAITRRKELEDQGKIAEDDKKFGKLNYKANKEALEERIKNPDISKAKKKELEVERQALMKKDGSRLDKISAGIGGLFAMGKKGLKVAALGGMALLSTLAIGGMLFALGEFLQGDTFKKMTKFIQGTIIPKLKEFYNAFFGEGGGLWTGIKALFGDVGGLGGVVIGITAVTGLLVASKLAKIFGPLKGALGGLLSGIGGLVKKIPGMPGGKGAAGKVAGGATSVGKGGGMVKAAKGLATMGKAAGKGIGAFIGGILKGIASGLAAIAKPLVLLGLAAVTAALWLLEDSFEPIGKMVKLFGAALKLVFEGIAVVVDKFGSGLKEVLEGIATVVDSIGGAIGNTIKAVGDSIGHVIDKISSLKTAGTEATTAQIEKLSAIPGLKMIDTARGIVAIKKALDGFGGGTFTKISTSLFGGGGPIDKMIDLAKKVPELMKAAEAIAVLGAAGSDFAKAEAEIKRRKEVSELRKKTAGGTSTVMGIGYTEKNLTADKAKLAALEGQAMPMGGPSNVAAKVAQMKYGLTEQAITRAIDNSQITAILSKVDAVKAAVVGTSAAEKAKFLPVKSDAAPKSMDNSVKAIMKTASAKLPTKRSAKLPTKPEVDAAAPPTDSVASNPKKAQANRMLAIAKGLTSKIKETQGLKRSAKDKELKRKIAEFDKKWKTSSSAFGDGKTYAKVRGGSDPRMVEEAKKLGIYGQKNLSGSTGNEKDFSFKTTKTEDMIAAMKHDRSIARAMASDTLGLSRAVGEKLEKESKVAELKEMSGVGKYTAKTDKIRTGAFYDKKRNPNKDIRIFQKKGQQFSIDLKKAIAKKINSPSLAKGAKSNGKKLEDMKIAATAASAQNNVGGSAPTIINAPTSSSVVSTAPSGQHSLTKTKYAKLNQGYGLGY